MNLGNTQQYQQQQEYINFLFYANIIGKQRGYREEHNEYIR